MKLLNITIIVALCAIFIFFWVKTDSFAPPKLGAMVEEEQVRILSPEEAKRNQSHSVMHSSRQMEAVQWDNTQRSLGLATFAIPVTNQVASIQLEITTQGYCFPGDANAIAMELSNFPSHKVIATLEPLSGKSPSGYWVLPKSFFTQGRAEHRFELPVSHEPVQYGFYLCTTEGSDQSCRQKKVVDLNDVFTEHIQKLPQAGKELRTLFFQYLFLDDRGFTTFVDIPLGEQKFQQLKSYLKQRSTSKNDLDNAVDMSQSNIKTLQSLPFQFDGTTIKVALPEYQPQMCGNSHQREGK